MTFTFMDIIIIGGFCLSIMTFCFGIVKFFNSSTHKRIDEVKSDFEKEVKDIRENYAHKDNINQAMIQIKEIVSDLKKEQHRMASRMDELWKWIVTKGAANDKGMG
jgi:septal ring factor EnvC (AmiA/AmiB activator)